MKADYPSVLLIYTGGTIGMIENPETGALENFNDKRFSMMNGGEGGAFTTEVHTEFHIVWLVY